MLFGLGPQFIMAEPGTDPLNEPELFRIRRRKKGAGCLWWMLGIGILSSCSWWLWGVLHRG